MKLILLLVNFGRTIKIASVYCCLCLIFLFMLSIGMSGVLRYWSMMDMSESCCCCDPSSAGTLTRVKSIEYVCECVVATDGA
jgi:hypothetical protein